MSIPLPTTMPLLINELSSDGAKEVFTAIVANSRNDLALNLFQLGRYWRVKVWFSEPIEIQGISRWTRPYLDEQGRSYRTRTSGKKTTDVHIFCGGFFMHGDRLCYKFKKRGRHGMYLPLDKIVRYEPLPNSTLPKDEFKGYEEFRKKFDLRFITEQKVQELWMGTSAQHGGKYLPSDFRRIGHEGLRLMERFLKDFQGVISDSTAGYINGSRREEYNSFSTNSHFGRDITISHTLGHPMVYYSSEYAGTGNGTYGLVATPKEYLWLEND